MGLKYWIQTRIIQKWWSKHYYEENLKLRDEAAYWKMRHAEEMHLRGLSYQNHESDFLRITALTKERDYLQEALRRTEQQLQLEKQLHEDPNR